MPQPRYENLSGPDLQKAQKAWSDCVRAAQLAHSATQTIPAPQPVMGGHRAAGPRAMPMMGGHRGNQGADRYVTWFGAMDMQRLLRVKQNVSAMLTAINSRPITFVYRPNIVVKTAPENMNEPMQPVHLSDGSLFSGQNVYGYVHRHVAGSGMRVILGRWFLDDPDPITGAAQTMYHELTHKVFGTKDHIYGVDESKQLASTSPHLAIDNADSYAFYAVSFLKTL